MEDQVSGYPEFPALIGNLTLQTVVHPPEEALRQADLGPGWNTVRFAKTFADPPLFAKLAVRNAGIGILTGHLGHENVGQVVNLLCLARLFIETGADPNEDHVLALATTELFNIYSFGI